MAAMSRDLIEVGLPWRYTPARIAALIADPDVVALVARDANGLQGLAVMQFADELAHLILLCVQPARQRHGVGHRLHHWLLASAQVAGMQSIHLELREDNLRALDFYRRLGFTETRWLPGYYAQQLAARRMVLRLRSDAAP